MLKRLAKVIIVGTIVLTLVLFFGGVEAALFPEDLGPASAKEAISYWGGLCVVGSFAVLFGGGLLAGICSGLGD